jgi:hypothetical protein
MVNPLRGEVEAVLDGERRKLRLTLGSLAELEQALEAQSLAALAARFEQGGLRTGDVTRVLAAGLRGAGAEATPEDVGRMSVEGGAAGAARIAARLLRAAFTGEAA